STPTETPTSTPTAQVVTIDIGDGVALANSSVDITVSLATAGLLVGGTANDITFPSAAFTVNPASCVLDPSIPGTKLLVATLVPGVPNSTLTVFVQDPGINGIPIADGPLYKCTFNVLASAPPGVRILVNGNAEAQDPMTVNIPFVNGTNGTLE